MTSLYTSAPNVAARQSAYSAPRADSCLGVRDFMQLIMADKRATRVVHAVKVVTVPNDVVSIKTIKIFFKILSTIGGTYAAFRRNWSFGKRIDDWTR